MSVVSHVTLLPIGLRKLPDEGEPAAGELWIRPARPEDRELRSTALLVYERGLDVLERGPDPVEFIVVDVRGVQPTFDEMLAALLAQHLLTGQELPSGFRGLAEYARLIRQGLIPTSLPVEQTLEGIYQAVRNRGGGDLTDPQAGEAFLARWQLLAARLRKAAETGEDVFHQSLFAAGADFAEEQAYLRRDEDAYRQDVARGERGKGRLPDGPPASSCLLLRTPKSLLFPFWSRRDRETPTGAPYLFLAVSWGDGEWVFSTDPVQKCSLKSLAELLQRAEVGRDPEAVHNPWFDGRGAFQHTLVTNPKEGTKLTDKEVLRSVRKWTRQETKTLRRWAPVLAGVAGLLLIGTFVGYWLSQPVPIDITLPIAEVEYDHRLSRLCIDGKPQSLPKQCRGMDAGEGGVIFGVQQSISLRRDTNVSVEEENRFGHGRAVKLRIRLHAESHHALTAQHLLGVRINGVRINDRDRKEDWRVRAKEDGSVEADLKTALRSKQNVIQVLLGNPEDKPIPAVLEVSWSDDPHEVTLHVLAVGVSKYKSAQVNQLNFAHEDAIQLTAALKSSEGRLFKKVIDHSPLINDAADANTILTALDNLKQAQEHDLAIIIFSGHGTKFPNSDHYYFLPSDHNPDKKLGATGLAWAILKDYLGQIKCRVVLIMDTCHSGAVGLKGGDGPNGDLDKAVAKALGEFSKAKRGIIVLAACLGEQQAEEHPEWQHGALSLAILECLQGKRAAPRATDEVLSELLENRQKKRAGVITLEDVAKYAKERVPKLVKRDGGQAVVLQALNDITAQQIPLAVFGE